jgi:2,3-bisphosphoglycerate-independent phosphoglycerate mutase
VPLVLTADEPLRPHGGLRDLAPTVLDLLGLPQPAEMSGESLRIRDEKTLFARR